MASRRRRHNKSTAVRHVDHLDRLNFDQFKVSVKASDVFLAVESYRLLAKQIDQPLHLGITEAGGARSGAAVKSAIGLGLLLSGDRRYAARLAGGGPGGEDQVGFDILKSLRIRSAALTLSPARPVHARSLTLSVRWSLEQRVWRRYHHPMDVSIIGCVSERPGEALVSTLGVWRQQEKRPV
ncbi:flavodoxin-dependent (E)-4-hydroxy-3-methylbut-2-enyl-diphosphate synthase [Klebsiella pneumoniae]|nr:flavodoxin-dependent (E)-4-hydroxy-3-methylbut-2-enyl-diphosphate synthase [Klebsiella pneumoniae]